MTGFGYQVQKLSNNLANVAPGPAGKAWKEVGRVSAKYEDQLQRTRRMISPKAPKALEPVTPSPLATPVDGPDSVKKEKYGRGSTVLAGRLNQKRSILDTRKAGTGLLS